MVVTLGVCIFKHVNSIKDAYLKKKEKGCVIDFTEMHSLQQITEDIFVKSGKREHDHFQLFSSGV